MNDWFMGLQTCLCDGQAGSEEFMRTHKRLTQGQYVVLYVPFVCDRPGAATTLVPPLLSDAALCTVTCSFSDVFFSFFFFSFVFFFFFFFFFVFFLSLASSSPS
jgi:hypothetical protein